MRTFESGATRDSEGEKLDYEGFLSPQALEAYANYMHGHRRQADGKLRASDNWQNGIPMPVYMKSLCRHLFSAWAWHRRPGAWDEEARAFMIEALCGILFNTFGYLHEFLADWENAQAELAEGKVIFNQPDPPAGWTEKEKLD